MLQARDEAGMQNHASVPRVRLTNVGKNWDEYSLVCEQLVMES